MKKVLFINPANDPVTSEHIIIEPIDVLQAATTVKHYGHEVKLCDLDVHDTHKQTKLENILHTWRPDYIVCIFDYHIPLHIESALKDVIQGAYEWKKILSDVQVIIAGKIATFMPQKCIYEGSPLDIAVAYDVEEPLKALFSHNALSKEVLQTIPSISFRDNKLIRTAPAQKKPDITELPIPDRSLIDLGNYIDVRTILSSRGCMLKCSFCHVPGFWGQRQGRRPEQVVDEIEYLVKDFHAKKILFLDDNTTVDAKRMHAICDEIIKRDIHVSLGCLSTIHSFNDELMQHMYDAGFRRIHYGVESGDEAQWKKIRKGLTREKVVHAIAKSKEIGLRVRTSWIIDLPELTKESLQMTLDLIKETQSDEVRLHFLAIRLGSEIHANYYDTPDDLPKQYIHRGESTYNYHDIPVEYIKEKTEGLIDYLKGVGYTLIRSIDDNKQAPDAIKAVSLCPLRYGIHWSENVWGVTGDIAAGKSYICSELQKAHPDTILISVDQIRRDIISLQESEENKAIRARLIEELGTKIVGNDGQIDRIKLGKQMFRSKKAMEIYRGIINPRIIHEVKQQIKQHHNAPLILVERAGLVEDEMLSLVHHKVLLVECNKETQEKRLEAMGGDLLQRAERFMQTAEKKELLGHKGTLIVRDTSNDATLDYNSLYLQLTTGTMSTKKKYPFCLFNIKEDGARVIWEVTNACNYTCSYCIFSSKWGNDQYDLSTENMKRALDDLWAKGVKYFKVTGGEPFLRKDMLELLTHASNLGFTIDVSTNASLLNKTIVEGMKKLRITYVHVSLDGQNKEIQEAVRGKATFDPTIKGIKLLIASGMNVRVGTLIHARNERSLEEVITFVESLGVPQVIFSYMEAVGKLRDHDNSPLLATREREDLENLLSGLHEKYKDRIDVQYSFVEPVEAGSACGTCPGGKEFLFIDHKGQISPCTWISEYFPQFVSTETLHTANFEKIMNQKPMQMYLQLIEDLKTYGIQGCPKSFLGDLRGFFNVQKALTTSYEEIHVFTRKNIASYYEKFDWKDKTALVIGASGDHLLNAYALGAKHVNCIDTHSLTKYFIELKWHAAKTLDYHTFIAFISQTFDYKIYTALREKLTPATQYFWDMTYKKYGNEGRVVRMSPLFHQTTPTSIIEHNVYLQSEEAYKNLQARLQDATYEHISTALEKLPMTQKYDLIVLGSSSNYAHLLYPEGDATEKYFTLMNKVKMRLTPGGILQAAYLYSAEEATHLAEKNNFYGYNILRFPALRSNQKKEDIILYTTK